MKRTVEISVEVSLDDPAAHVFQGVVARWFQARQALMAPGGEAAGNRLPADRLFWTEQLPDFPGRLSILQPQGDGDFRYLIHAGATVDAGGADMTGRLVSEFPYPDFRNAILEFYQLVLERAAPVIWRFRHRWRDKMSDYFILALPVTRLRDDRTAIHSILVNTDPDRRTMYRARFLTGRSHLRPEDVKD